MHLSDFLTRLYLFSKMPLSLLDLPPELLLQILSTLPTNPLLRFAQTSQYARKLAYSNLHVLFLAISPSCQSPWYNKLIPDAYSPKLPSHPDYNPHKLLIRIPQAWDFDYSTLLTFHNKITTSILHRHASTLRKIDLTLWTLSIPIAKALTDLPALRDLSIRIESMQIIPRACLALQRKEEHEAWGLLASTPAFLSQICTLGIENAQVDVHQLRALVSGIKTLRELRLSKCGMLTSSIWNISSLTCLRHLCITDCLNMHVNETALETISRMHKLQVRQPRAQPRKIMSVVLHTISGRVLTVSQVLDLHGCSGLDGEVLEQWNIDVWHVPAFVAPRAHGVLKEMGDIEVDPDYMLGYED